VSSALGGEHPWLRAYDSRLLSSLARQASDTEMSCHAQWLLLTLIMTIVRSAARRSFIALPSRWLTSALAQFLALLGAANVTMLLFAFKIISHGHKRKVAMVQGGQEEKTEYKLW